jgi:hypothetical protein
MSKVTAMMFLLVVGIIAGEAQTQPQIEITSWSVRKVPSGPDKYWVSGYVRNLDTVRLADVLITFSVLAPTGREVGETTSDLKLVTLLPGQTSLFAAPVRVHDRHISRMTVKQVYVKSIDDRSANRTIPFTSKRKSFALPH